MSQYNNQELLPIEELQRLFEYDSVIGCLRWLVAPDRKPTFRGKRPGYQGSGGYQWIKTRYMDTEVRFSEHQAVWALLRGYWPTEIDHINGNPQDNKIENLREVDRSTNLRNAKKRSNNISGVTGVCWDTRTKKWRASIRTTYDKSLGYYNDFEDAVAARRIAETQYGYHENHGRA